MTDADVPSVASLLEALAREHITPEFSQQATARFLENNNEDRIRAFVEHGFRYHVAESRDRIVGFVGVRDNRHLFHLFVANDRQRQGLGRRLWAVAREACIAAGNPGSFTLNSSNNAVPVYERLGFARSGPPRSEGGVLYNPMATQKAGAVRTA